MKKNTGQPTDAELAILRLLWDAEWLSSAEVRRELYPEGTPSDYATVQKLLERLEAKGLVERDRTAGVHRFRALQSRSEIVSQQLQELAAKLTDGSLVPLIMNAVGQKSLSEAERREIRALLDRRK